MTKVRRIWALVMVVTVLIQKCHANQGYYYNNQYYNYPGSEIQTYEEEEEDKSFYLRLKGYVQQPLDWFLKFMYRWVGYYVLLKFHTAKYTTENSDIFNNGLVTVALLNAISDRVNRVDEYSEEYLNN